MRGNSPEENIDNPCSKALTVLRHTRIIAKYGLDYLEFFSETESDIWKSFPQTFL